eukprot:Nitzschia sp. Nitz4//scaffold210_size37948//30083//30961//NITZ4_007694-RA/size37948-processed-gene-0.44-mRNA-1//1//CDS//3329541942//7640//frame0
MFEGFTQKLISIPNRINIHVRYAGAGPPVLLLHGYPQTSACWHLVAPQLVDAGYTVVVPDLRGYGRSDKPVSLPDHSTYSKREMAMDQTLLMKELGFDQFYLAGHDRGGRVAHRMALDHPEAVLKLAVLDIAPTATMYETTNKEFATGYYHWFFLIQPSPLPEKFIASDPEYYLRLKLQSWGKSGMSVYSEEAVEEYIRYFKEPECIDATCEDYRAAATIDLEHDKADSHKLQSPMLALWGSKGLVGRLYDVLGVWKEKSNSTVEGKPLPCGHFVPEEQANLTSQALINFFR